MSSHHCYMGKGGGGVEGIGKEGPGEGEEAG